MLYKSGQSEKFHIFVSFFVKLVRDFTMRPAPLHRQLSEMCQRRSSWNAHSLKGLCLKTWRQAW